MSNNGVIKQGIRQVQKGLSERVAGLEQGLGQILFGVNDRFQKQDARLAGLEEKVEALIELNGTEEVGKIIAEKRAERAAAQAEQEKATLDQGVADGYVLKADTVAEKSVIVVQYRDPKGEIIPPGRAQLVMPGVDTKYRDKLLNQAVGFKMDLDGGATCELLEVYSVDEEKAKAVMAAKQKEAQEQAAAATAAATAAAGETAKADEAQAAPEAPAPEAPPAEAAVPAEAAPAPSADNQ